MSPEELGLVALSLPFVLVAAVGIVFAILGFLVPWFVWRISVYSQETRDLIRDVKISLNRANRHLATMAHDSK